MKTLLLTLFLLALGTYFYLDTYFERNNPPPLCLISESELSGSMSDAVGDVNDPYTRIGYDMGESMVMSMRRKACDGRPLTKRIPERLAYELKKLQKKF